MEDFKEMKPRRFRMTLSKILPDWWGATEAFEAGGKEALVELVKEDLVSFIEGARWKVEEVKPKLGELRAWAVECCGVKAIVFERSRSKARYFAARSAHDAGYVRNVGEALRTARVKRAPEFDADAEARGREGFK